MEVRELLKKALRWRVVDGAWVMEKISWHGSILSSKYPMSLRLLPRICFYSMVRK